LLNLAQRDNIARVAVEIYDLGPTLPISYAIVNVLLCVATVVIVALICA